MDTYTIQPLTFDHLHRYAEIYAAAFAGSPWNDPWRVEDAEIHVREIMEMKQSFGLELVAEGEVAGIILGSATLFHNGRSFEINDLVVAPEYQRRGFARALMDACLAELKQRGIVEVHLTTAPEGRLPAFYESFGFQKKTAIILMGMQLEN